jgi:uncharacterized protein GlcG (DUF336 family)
LVEEEASRVGVSLPSAPSILSIEMAARKTYTAAALEMRTADMTPLAKPGEALYTITSVAAGRHTVLVFHADRRPIHRRVGVSGGTT